LEELKNQLGDSLPGAVQVFSRALNVSEAELFKLMEQGKLLSADVLPKVAKEFRKSALEGGAFDKALQGLRVTEGQFITGAQRAGDTIFKSGFSEGLSELYKTMSEIFKDAGPQLEKIGKIFGTAFKAIAYTLKLIEPPLSLIINNIEYLAGGLMIKKLMLLRATLATTFLPITVALAAAEELISLFSDKLVGVTEKALGAQINLAEGTKTALVEKDGKLYSDPNSTKDYAKIDKDFMYGPAIGLIKKFGKSDFSTENSKRIMQDLQGRSTRSEASRYYSPEPMKPMVTQEISIKVEGVSGEDVAYKIKRHLAEFTGNGGGR